MRSPARPFIGRQQQSYTASIPAPVGGLNTFDALANMPATDAVLLENWFPSQSAVQSRGGSKSHATGVTGNGKTLAVYSDLTGNEKLFCFTNSGVYNVSNTGAVGASLAARTNGKHQYKIFGDGTSQWLIACNGADKPLYYDGTTWLAVDGTTSPALTGVASTVLVSPFVYNGRLFFLEKSTLKFWYLPAGVAGGALVAFDVSGVAQRGGFLLAAVTWTVDAGNGPDDRLILITSVGEIISYIGTNPGAAATWELAGKYIISKPLGRKCTINVGSDVYILTDNGVFSLSSVLSIGGLNKIDSLSKKIDKVFTADALLYGNNYGWMAIAHYTQSAVIINVPVNEDTTHNQYVVNITSGAWCKFTGWNGEDFAVFNDELYYCQGTVVSHAWTGASDYSNNISLKAKQAYYDFDRPGKLKEFTMFRPMLATNGNMIFAADIDVDYENNILINQGSINVSGGFTWGISYWGMDYWASDYLISKNWITPSCYEGFNGALKLNLDTKSVTVQWIATDYIFKDGGIL